MSQFQPTDVNPDISSQIGSLEGLGRQVLSPVNLPKLWKPRMKEKRWARDPFAVSVT
jgi:hypothetical protein